MQITITARHLTLSDDLKSVVNEKLSRLSRYSRRLREARVVFTLEKAECTADITITGKRFRISAVERAADGRMAFDRAAANIENQLKRQDGRIKDHRIKRFLEGLSTFHFRKKDEQPNVPRIIKTDSFAVKPMSCDEAAQELELFDKEFIVFRNSNTDRFSVIYRRKDGNYGLIEP